MDLPRLFFEYSDVAIMHWQRVGDDLQLIEQNSRAIALLSHLLSHPFQPGDLLCEVAPSHRTHNDDLGMPLIDWYIQALDTQEVQHQTFYFESEANTGLTGYWENTSVPHGEFLMMKFRNVSKAEMERQNLLAGLDTDYLTQVASRKSYEETIAQHCNAGQPFTLALIDLNNFKSVNDTYGHAFGDHLLQAIAQRIKASLRGMDYVARLGGDEFAAIIPGSCDPEAIGQRIHGAVIQPVQEGELWYLPSASVGLAVYEIGDTPATIYQYADEFEHRAKTRMKNGGHRSYWVCDRSQSYHLLSKALVQEMASPKSLSLHYQPIVELKTLQPKSYEALVRWDRGNPGTILEIVQRHQLDIDFCLWTIEQAQKQWEQWRSSLQKIAVNASPSWLANPRVINAFLANPGTTCEITEDELISSPETIEAIEILHKRGVYCSIDDFGSRYAILENLGILPVDALKLDISITNKPDVARGVVHFAEDIYSKINLVAEGIETQDQLELYRDIVPYGQGYLFGRPQPGEHINLGTLP